MPLTRAGRLSRGGLPRVKVGRAAGLAGDCAGRGGFHGHVRVGGLGATWGGCEQVARCMQGGRSGWQLQGS